MPEAALTLPSRAATVRERCDVRRALDAPLRSRLGALWCSVMHGAPMWPMHGTYQCRECGRCYPVPWAGERVRQPVPLMMRQAGANKDARRALKH